MDPTADNPTKPLPRHVAVIMDGNGRWATAQGKSRSYGHHKGAERVPPLVTRACDLGLEALTLYSFSTENWTRSHEEVGTLMALYTEYLKAQLPQMLANNVQFRHVGLRDGLPNELLDAFDEAYASTRDHTGMTLCLAINYGSRAEIARAVRCIASKVADGALEVDAITPDLISNHLDTAGLPDPDLLIRTAGELRLSNYLLWQCSYAEIVVVNACWPDFTVESFDQALHTYTHRERKFGAAPKAAASPV